MLFQANWQSVSFCPGFHAVFGKNLRETAKQMVCSGACTGRWKHPSLPTCCRCWPGVLGTDSLMVELGSSCPKPYISLNPASVFQQGIKLIKTWKSCWFCCEIVCSFLRHIRSLSLKISLRIKMLRITLPQILTGGRKAGLGYLKPYSSCKLYFYRGFRYFQEGFVSQTPFQGV